MTIIITPSILSNDDSSVLENQSKNNAFQNIVVPGEVIFTSGTNLITGHGTYRSDNSSQVYNDIASHNTAKVENSEIKLLNEKASVLPMYASLCGHLKSVNKLMYVKPPKARYAGNVGDTVVGRIIEVEQRRWKVDVNSYHLANLSLANVKLPTGELRRKSEDDERAMRSFMREGDLIVAEVREVFRDGSLQLHMPGKRTGRLGEGCLLRLPPGLIRRQKIHRHNLAVPKGLGVDHDEGDQQTSLATVSVGLILGCNGHVWIGPSRGMELGLCLGASISGILGGSDTCNHKDLLAEYVAVSRVRNVILALSEEGMAVWETSVLAACETSWLDEFHLNVQDDIPETATVNRSITRLLQTEHRKRLVALVAAKMGVS